MSLGEYLNYWLDTYARHNLRPTTYRNYRSYLNLHVLPALGSIPLQKLSAAQVQALGTA